MGRPAALPLRVLLLGTDGFAATSLRRLAQHLPGVAAAQGVDVGGGAELKKLNLKLELERLDVVAPLPKRRVRRGQQLLSPQLLSPAAAHSIGPDSTVRDVALHLGLKVWDAPKTGGIRPEDASWEPAIADVPAMYDVGVVVSFGYFLPRALIEAFPLGAINIHPSLLPIYRGASPIQHSLMHGDADTGVSVIRVDPRRFDSGAILSQSTCQIAPNETYAPLCRRLAHQGAEQLVSVLADLQHLGEVPGERAQAGAAGQARAPKITDKQRRVRFQSQSARHVLDKQRALEANGGLFTLFKGKRLRLLSVAQAPADSALLREAAAQSYPPGTLIAHRTRGVPEGQDDGKGEGKGKGETKGKGKDGGRQVEVGVVCANGSVVQLLQVQLEGRKAQDAEHFVNGHVQGKGFQFVD